MIIKDIPIDALSHDPSNVRKHNDPNIKAIKASLKRFGQQKPIVVDGNLVVRAGNGTMQAAQELGWETIRVVQSDLSPSELTAFAIADNRTSDLAEWDQAELAKQLAALDEEGFAYDELGFSSSLFGIEEEVQDAWKDMPEYEQGDQMPKFDLKINFESEDDLMSFSELIGQKLTVKTKSVWFPEKERQSLKDMRYVSEEDNVK